MPVQTCIVISDEVPGGQTCFKMYMINSNTNTTTTNNDDDDDDDDDG